MKVSVVVLTFALVLAHRSSVATILEDLDDQDDQVARSFMQFHGPVEGPGFEVKLPVHDHTGNQEKEFLDYVAHPRYEFSYGVQDQQTGDFHSQKEARDGTSVSGEYSLKDPDGWVRLVSYRADRDGFHATVSTTVGDRHQEAAGQGQQAQQEHRNHDYAQGY